MTKYRDVELLEMLRGTNPIDRDKALKEVYRGAYKMIEQMVIKNNGLAADAEDIFHDGLISFYKQAQNGLELTCKVNTYMYSICRNLWLKKLRKVGRNDRLEDQHNEVVEMDRNPEEFLIQDDCATIIADHLKELGDNCKQIIVYSYFDQYNAEEIAKLMNYATAQVARNKKSGCLKKFRTLVLSRGESDTALRQCLQAYL